MNDIEKLREALRKEREAHKETRRRLTQGKLPERLHNERCAHAQTRSVLARALADLAEALPTHKKEPDHDDETRDDQDDRITDRAPCPGWA